MERFGTEWISFGFIFVHSHWVVSIEDLAPASGQRIVLNHLLTENKLKLLNLLAK